VPGARPVAAPGTTADPSTADPSTAARQRWRLVLACGCDASGRSGRDQTEMWEAALASSGLPLFCPSGRARARVAFGAPLPTGIAGERELADILLARFEPAWRVREALAGHLPDGWRLVDLYDIWLGAPALAGQVVAADYRIDLGDVDAGVIIAAVDALLAAERLPRERLKGGSTVRYDLRPLLAMAWVADPGPPLLLGIRTRFHPELGTGRPADVLAALGDTAGMILDDGSIVRERLILAEDLERVVVTARSPGD
jgi:hypothetical protein